MKRVQELKQHVFDGAFRWSLGVSGTDAESFFAPQDKSGQLLKEKQKWLELNPEMYLADTNEAQPLIKAVWELALQWGHVNEPEDGRTLINLARNWEADLLLVNRDAMSLEAGAVCFPSSWDLQSAIGKSVFRVHEIVPRLNAQIGKNVDRFLSGIQGGKSYTRMNWSLTRTNELNYHPALQRRKLDKSVSIEELFLRVEHQLFCEIDGGILMGLRIEPIPLQNLVTEPQTWSGIREKIQTMPDDVAAYKGMLTAKEALVEVMDAYKATLS